MPMIKRTIIEFIRRDIKCAMPRICCEGMKGGLKADYGPKLYGERLTVAGIQVTYCPWCGEKVMYDDDVTLPEGYERKLP